MTSEQDFQTTGNGEIAASNPQPVQSVDEALDQIDRILRQMLLLAELSASDGTVDRESLQRVLERLQSKLDRIADTI